MPKTLTSIREAALAAIDLDLDPRIPLSTFIWEMTQLMGTCDHPQIKSALSSIPNGALGNKKAIIAWINAFEITPTVVAE